MPIVLSQWLTHYAIRGQDPRETLADLEKRFLERELRPLGLEIQATVVASVYHMVETTARLDSEPSRPAQTKRRTKYVGSGWQCHLKISLVFFEVCVRFWSDGDGLGEGALSIVERVLRARKSMEICGGLGRLLQRCFDIGEVCRVVPCIDRGCRIACESSRL
jgi:hypothetical protein